MSIAININKQDRARLGTTEHVTQLLIRAIHDEVYKSGQRLTEAQLTRELGISRGSLREVLRRLAASGLIELQPNRGAVVKRISRESIMEILTTREVLEGLAASQAALNIRREGHEARAMAMLRTIQAVQKNNAGIDFLEDNTRFHGFIVELSNNKILQQQIDQLQLPGIRSRFFSRVSPALWQRSLQEHEIVLEAIMEADAMLAEQLMRAHVRRARRHFSELPESIYDA